MSLHPNPNCAIPEETRRVAQAAFPKGTLGLSIAKVFGSLYHDDQFATLFPDRGQPATSPARLALVSVLQYVEGFSDRQAADAVCSRIDWKYALALELTDPGFDHTVLSKVVERKNQTPCGLCPLPLWCFPCTVDQVLGLPQGDFFGPVKAFLTGHVSSLGVAGSPRFPLWKVH